MLDRPKVRIAHVHRGTARSGDAVLVDNRHDATVEGNQLLDIDVKLPERFVPEAQEVEDAIDPVESPATGEVGVDQFDIAVEVFRDALGVGRCEGLVHGADYIDGIGSHGQKVSRGEIANRVALTVHAERADRRSLSPTRGENRGNTDV